MRRASTLAFAGLCLLLWGGALRAEPAGALVGSLRTADGTALPHVVLTLVGPSGSRTLVTGPDGRFRAAGLPAGSYQVSADAPGFVLRPEARVDVNDREARLDLTLAPAPVRERVVVTATRGEAPLSTVGTSATVLDRAAIADRAPSSLLQLLQDVPGVTVARLGGLGPQSSVFVRGGESRFARVLVDGVPMNEPGGYFNFAGGVPLEVEQVEVVRGAASSLYSTDALGGVVHLRTRTAYPDARPGVHAEAEGGSFAWRRGAAGTSGRAGRADWNLGVQRLTTDNQGPGAAFEETAAAGSAGARLGDATTIRLVARGETSTAQIPGPAAFGRPDLGESYQRTGLVGAAHLRHTRERVSHELRAGLGRTDQLSKDEIDSGSFVPRTGDRVAPFPSFDFADSTGFRNDTRRSTLGYQVEYQAGTRALLTAGLEVERETGDLGSPGSLLSPSRDNFGGYLQGRFVVGERVFATIGGRLERNDSFGTRAVPRAAVAWRAGTGADATTVRASAGLGIKEPSFFESFGTSTFALGNPDLLPERSRTVDVGVEQRLAGGRLRLEATAFHHEYLDQIAYKVVSFEPFRGTYENLGKTRGRGVELGIEAAPTPHVSFAAHYTRLDGEILESASSNPLYAVGRPLLRRPEEQASITARAELGRLTVGATVVHVGSRADSDFLGLGLEENGAYTRVDVRARIRLGRGLEAFAVAENLFDRAYQEALGYPALGRSVRGGLRYRTGTP
jgi:vitamin B12 transporter